MNSTAGRDLDRFWAVALGNPASVAPGLGPPDATHRSAGARDLSVWLGDQAARVRTARDESAFVLVEGRRGHLEARDPAAAILQAQHEHRIAFARAFGSPLSLVVRSAADDTLLCVRDPLGVQPLFFAGRPAGVVVSPSPELLAQSGPDAAAPDRLALAEWVTTYATPMDRTLYAGVTRIPPGHSMLVKHGVIEISRYWLPGIAGSGDQIAEPEALARFEAEFDRATGRSAGLERCAVFLSGGIDSSLTAAALAQHHRDNGLEPPLALSLKFPHPTEDEEERTRKVAKALGLPHLVIPLDEAMGGAGIISAGIEASRHSWYPSPNPWSAAYEHLAVEAGRRGCRVAFNGEGGNDLLETPWELAADMIRGGEILGLRRFARAQSRYYGGSERDYFRDLFWRRGLMGLVRPPIHRALLDIWPRAALRIRERRAERTIPTWALPDDDLRREVVAARTSFASPLSARDLHGFARRRFLDDPFTSIMLDGIYLGSRRSEVDTVSAYFDPGLFELVFALPARALQIGDRAKGLAYASFARRVDPHLASQPGPTMAEETSTGAMAGEADSVLDTLGGLPRLAALGIVSEAAAVAACNGDATSRGAASPNSWHLLSTEAWLQSRSL